METDFGWKNAEVKHPEIVEVKGVENAEVEHVAEVEEVERAEVKERGSHKYSSSKYDYVKVRVSLNTSNYYILSRFLISRQLTLLRIPAAAAVRIALDLKKRLVDEGKLRCTQEEMERCLFECMTRRHYGSLHYIHRYRQVSAFHHRRTPVIVLVGGDRHTGKSTLVTQMSERLNLPNVMHADTLTVQVLKAVDPVGIPCGAWERGDVNVYPREEENVRRALNADLRKAVLEGKSLVLEGFYVDPSAVISSLLQSPLRTEIAATRAVLVGFLVVDASRTRAVETAVENPPTSVQEYLRKNLRDVQAQLPSLCGESPAEVTDGSEAGIDPTRVVLREVILGHHRTHGGSVLTSPSTGGWRWEHVLDEMHAAVLNAIVGAADDGNSTDEDASRCHDVQVEVPVTGDTLQQQQRQMTTTMNE